MGTPRAAAGRGTGAPSPLTPSTTPAQAPTFGPEQGSVAGVVAVGFAVVLQGERKSISPEHPSAPPLLVPALSCGGQGPPGQQTSPLHGLRTSGSCCTSHISSRAGASPSPEKSPSRLPWKGDGLFGALNRHKLVLADGCLAVNPREDIFGHFLRSVCPGQRALCSKPGVHCAHPGTRICSSRATTRESTAESVRKH